MGRKARTRNKERRDKEKAARKQAKRAQYEAYRDAGRNSKSKHFRIITKANRKVRTVDHPNGICGNIGCIKCFGFDFRPWLSKKTGELKRTAIPQRVWARWNSREET